MFFSDGVSVEKCDDGKFDVMVDVPGCSSEDVQVDVSGRTINISWKRSVGSGRGKRSFVCPSWCDTASAEAEVKNGVLNLRLPAKESDVKRIAVR